MNLPAAAAAAALHKERDGFFFFFFTLLLLSQLQTSPRASELTVNLLINRFRSSVEVKISQYFTVWLFEGGVTQRGSMCHGAENARAFKVAPRFHG